LRCLDTRRVDFVRARSNRSTISLQGRADWLSGAWVRPCKSKKMKEKSGSRTEAGDEAQDRGLADTPLAVQEDDLRTLCQVVPDEVEHSSRPKNSSGFVIGTPMMYGFFFIAVEDDIRVSPLNSRGGPRLNPGDPDDELARCRATCQPSAAGTGWTALASRKASQLGRFVIVAGWTTKIAALHGILLFAIAIGKLREREGYPGSAVAGWASRCSSSSSSGVACCGAFSG